MIPEHLRINGRQPDSHFPGDERLFRGFREGAWPISQEQAFLLIGDFPLCVAREKYCHSPSDVLHVLPKSVGVVSWMVQQIPQRFDANGSTVYLRVEHVPENDFYPHTEVRTYDTAEYVRQCEPKPKSLRGLLRWELARIATPEVVP
jgi:hypothetical protein